MADIVDTSYNNTKVQATGDVTARSQIPTDINQPTKLALLSTLRSVDDNKANVSDGVINYSQKILAEIGQDVDSKLSNFKPAVISGNSIQRKGVKKQIDEAQTALSARQSALTGADPVTQSIAQKLKELTALANQKQQLLKQTEDLKNQIDALTNKLINATNFGQTQLLQDLENQIESIQNVYDTTKETLDRINKAYNKAFDALEKARITKELALKTIPKKLRELEQKLLSLPEIPTAIKFPSFPKLPAINLTKANFKQQLSNLKTTIISAGRAAAKQSIDLSAKESKERLNTGKNMDAFQTAASGARSAIKTLRNQAEAVQSAQAAAVQAAADVLKTQISVLQKQAAVMEANINDSIDTAALRIDSNIKAIRSTAGSAQQRVTNAIQTSGINR